MASEEKERACDRALRMGLQLGQEVRDRIRDLVGLIPGVSGILADDIEADIREIVADALMAYDAELVRLTKEQQ